MANAITSLRFCATLDWSRFVESVSQVEQVLHHDPVGVYGADGLREPRSLPPGGRGARRRHRRRTGAGRAAERGGAREVPARAGRPARCARRLLPDRTGHGADFERQIAHRPRLAQRLRRVRYAMPRPLYLGSIALLTALIARRRRCGTRWLARRHAGRAALGRRCSRSIPASDLATAVVQRIAGQTDQPAPPAAARSRARHSRAGRTMVIVPTLFGSVAGGRGPAGAPRGPGARQPGPAPALRRPQRLHRRRRRRTCPATRRSSRRRDRRPASSTPGTAATGRTRFYLFHRDRLWNEKESRWMGWERKRGKIEEFNRLLRGATDTSFHHVVGDRSTFCRHVRYCLTLDTDTRLPRDAAQRADRHHPPPANRPRSTPALRRVTQGYGILQPRVSVTMASAAGSLFARVYAGHTGVDPYTTAVSDVYQDLFGEGIFAGKGLYHVDAFMATLDGRVPENALLSHDLFEGLHARAALVTDIELVDDYPADGAGPRPPAAPLGARRLADPALAVPVRADGAAAWRATSCRSSAAGRSSTTCGAAWWRRRCSRSSSPAGPSCRARPLVWTAMALAVIGAPAAADAGASVHGAPGHGRPIGRLPAAPRRRRRDGVRAGRCCTLDAAALPRLGDGARDHPDAGAAGHHPAAAARMGDGGQRRRRAAGSARRRGPARRSSSRWRRARSSRCCCSATVAVVAPAALLVARSRSSSAGCSRRSSPLAQPARRAARRWRWSPTSGGTAPPGAQDLALLRGVRRSRRPLAAARQLPGSARQQPRAAHLADQHRHGPAVHARRARPRLHRRPRELIRRSRRCSTPARDSSGTRAICSTGTTRRRWRRCGRATSRRWTAATW